MPTLFRFVLILAILAGLGFAGLLMLVTFVEPEQREITEIVNPPRLTR